MVSLFGNFSAASCHLAAVLLLALAGCGAKPETVVVWEVSVNCPRGTPLQSTTPLQVEATIAVPLEIAVAGMPALWKTISISEPGRSRLYLVFYAHGETNNRGEILHRIGDADLFMPHTAPAMSEIFSMPELNDGAPNAVVEIRPDKNALARENISERVFWRALSEQPESANELDGRARELSSMTLRFGDRKIPLTEIAAIERDIQPSRIVRVNGMRLAKLQELDRQSKRANKAPPRATPTGR